MSTERVVALAKALNEIRTTKAEGKALASALQAIGFRADQSLGPRKPGKKLLRTLTLIADMERAARRVV